MTDKIHDYDSFMKWAHAMCQPIDQLEQLIFEKDSPGARFQERLVYAAKVFRDSTKENDHAINLQKSSPDFKRGLIFAMRCIIDMDENKDKSYSGTDLVEFLDNFLLVNRAMENVENMKQEEKLNAD